MQKNSVQIIWLGCMIGATSALYFFSLVFGIPVLITAIFVLPAGYFSYKKIIGTTLFTEAETIPVKEKRWIYFILLTGIFLMVNKGYYVAEKYGEWDAWGIWNLHAAFLKDPQHWKNYLDWRWDAHPDYPLCSSAFVAFFWRLTNNVAPVTPFLFNAFITIAIPVLLFLEFYRKNLWLAAIVFLLFATDEFYITRGLSGYADTLLAFFFLSSFICLKAFRETRHKGYLLLAAASLGFAAWTKNEGILLGGLVFLYYFKTFFSLRNLGFTVAGLLLPLLSLLVFKMVYAPGTDLVSMSGTKSFLLLEDGNRYQLVYDKFITELKEHFSYHCIGLGLFILLCLLKKEWPGKGFFLILTALAAFYFVYVLSPQNLEWHLNTSLNRVLLQIAPAFIYIICQKLASIKITLE